MPYYVMGKDGQPMMYPPPPMYYMPVQGEPGKEGTGPGGYVAPMYFWPPGKKEEGK